MAKARIVGRLDASQNLSTSPFTVSGLKGDTFDYTFMVFCDSASTTADNVAINVNSDTGANYNRYYMRGQASTASASVSTSQTAIQCTSFTRQTSGRNSLLLGSLVGESGNERKVSLNFTGGFSPTFYIVDAYWTNTADEADEITFTGTANASYTWHIVVWEVPKASNLDGWEYVNKLDWSSETAEKSFTTDGDTDIQYLLDWDGDQELDIECNNDNGSNYTRQQLRNAGGTIQALNQTTNTSISGDGINARVIINAESGVDRLVHYSCSDTVVSQQNQMAIWWQNTGANLTSLDCTPQASATGTAKLYRKKLKPSMQTDFYGLPFRTIEEYDVSGDFSAGYTFSNLKGDDYLIFKVEWLGVNTSGNVALRVQLNADTGSNYTRQYLQGQSSTASSGSSTGTFLNLAAPQNATSTSGESYFYTKSGEYRPSLNTRFVNENTFVKEARWWLNSADEITSLKVYANSTNSLTGKLRVSAIYA